jgi:hypothetical protein
MVIRNQKEKHKRLTKIWKYERDPKYSQGLLIGAKAMQTEEN